MKRILFTITLGLSVFNAQASERKERQKNLTQNPFAMLDNLPDYIVLNEIVPKLDDQSLSHWAQSSKKYAELFKEELDKRKGIKEKTIERLKNFSIKQLEDLFEAEKLEKCLAEDEILKNLRLYPEQLRRYAREYSCMIVQKDVIKKECQRAIGQVYNRYENYRAYLKLDLIANNFRVVYPGVFDSPMFDDFPVLTLLGNHLINLNKDAFKGLRNLQKLNLSSNKLTNLDKDVFKELKNLEVLILGKNQLTKLDSAVFKELKNLKVLDLSDNKLTQLDPAIFKGLNNLKKLDLDKNRLTEDQALYYQNFNQMLEQRNIFRRFYKEGYFQVPSSRLKRICIQSIKVLYKGVFDIPKFKKAIGLDLSHNQLISLDKDIFKKLKNLKELDLSHNQLTELDPALFKDLKNLEELNFGSNNLTKDQLESLEEIKKTVEQRKKFKKMLSDDGTILDLRDCNIKIIYKGVFDASVFKNLKDLDLSGNQLTTLNPSIFKKLKNLESLKLYNNKLTQLDKDLFKKLKNLKGLYLHNNQLVNLDKEIFNELKHLKYLNISGNQLSDLSKDIFKELKSLEKLDLSRNQLVTLDKNIFNALSELKWLSLFKNQLTSLDKDTLKELQNLKELSLAGNQLTSIDENMFKELKNLKILSLSSNKLTTLDKNVFKELINLEGLSISGNQLINLNEDTFKKLQNLKELYLYKNQLSKDNIKKLKMALPKIKINF